MRELNEQNFEEINDVEIALVDFWASWCGPCKMMLPVLEQISKDYPLIHVFKVNVDENSEIAMKYNVRSLPTLILFKNGTPVKQTVGFTNKEKILEFVK